ncbi:Prophage CP4-57 regulatory protein (AlpA) [compost metagenome]
MANPTLSKLRKDAKAAQEKRHSETSRHQDAEDEFEEHTKAALKSYRLIKLPEVKALTTLSTSEIYRRIAAGTFPKQVLLGPKSAVWPEFLVLAWIEARITESREEVA